MLRDLLNKSWKQHHLKQQLYGLLAPISKAIEIIQTRHAGHSRRSKNEPISDVLLWIFSYGRAGVGRPARTYLRIPCTDTGYSLENLSEAMDDWDEWQEREREWERERESGNSMPRDTALWRWWWWWWYISHATHLKFNNLQNSIACKIVIFKPIYNWIVNQFFSHFLIIRVLDITEILMKC